MYLPFWSQILFRPKIGFCSDKGFRANGFQYRLYVRSLKANSLPRWKSGAKDIATNKLFRWLEHYPLLPMKNRDRLSHSCDGQESPHHQVQSAVGTKHFDFKIHHRLHLFRCIPQLFVYVLHFSIQRYYCRVNELLSQGHAELVSASLRWWDPETSSGWRSFDRIMLTWHYWG